MAETKNIKQKKDSVGSKGSVPKHSHNGHRQNMRQRFYEAGFNGMADHNVLEMLLFNGVPRKDTNQMAHDLIDMFGSYANVLEADRHDLMKVKGMTESASCLISMILPLYNRYVEDLQTRKPDPVGPAEVADFLRPKFFAGGCRERVFVLCYDHSNHLLACRQLNEGDLTSTAFDIREFGRLVLETNCSSVIIAHNHPHSISLPSQDDIQMTRVIISFLEMLKVNLKDHIIVSDTDYTSLAHNRTTMPLFYSIESLDEQIAAVREYERKRGKK